jgi:alpha-ketoglutarate-dependent taurine dioxygenase
MALNPIAAPPRQTYSLASEAEEASAWDAAALLRETHWQINLNAACAADLIQAASRQADRPVEQLDANDQPGEALPELAARMRRTLTQGCGVIWLRGLSGVQEPLLRRIYGLLAGCIGTPIDTYGRQYDVHDSGRSHLAKAIPVSQTNADTSFHTDSSSVRVEPDAVGLLCVRRARHGGRSLVSSARRAHACLRRADPRALQLLYRDYIRDLVTPGLDATDIIANRFPVFHCDRQYGLTLRYMRYWIEKGHQRAGLALDADEVAALDRLDALLGAPEHVVGFDLNPGDMLWVNNRSVAHNRTSYEDDPDSPRLMVRMWLNL